jgi:hypothetical protein
VVFLTKYMNRRELNQLRTQAAEKMKHVNNETAHRQPIVDPSAVLGTENPKLLRTAIAFADFSPTLESTTILQTIIEKLDQGRMLSPIELNILALSNTEPGF